MTIIAIPADHRNGHNPEPSIRAVELAGGQTKVITSAEVNRDSLAGSGGLLLADDALHEGNAPAGLRLLQEALSRDMPVLATGAGMHLLNAFFGGQPAHGVNGHQDHGSTETVRHQIYLSPGSKVAAIIGSAGMFRVNSRHGLGLREAQRAERLMTIAYQLDDGVIEGLESKEHSWVIAVQFLPERADEVPAGFGNLFLGLVERAQDFVDSTDMRRNPR